MKRSLFLLIAGLLAIFFSLNMMFMPGQMISMIALPTNDSTSIVLHWMGSVLFAFGVATVLARNDAGSPALRAILLGGVIVHVVGWGWDVLDYSRGYVLSSALIMGSLVHGILGVGFAFYYLRMEPAPAAQPTQVGTA